MLLGMSVVLNRTGRRGRHNVSTPCTVGIITKIVLISITSVNAIISYCPDCSIKSRSYWSPVSYAVMLLAMKFRINEDYMWVLFLIDNSNIAVITVVLKTDHTSEKMETNPSRKEYFLRFKQQIPNGSLFSFVKEPKKRLFTSFGVVRWQELEITE